MKLNKIVELLKNEGLLIENNINDNSIDYISYNSNDIKNNTLFFCKGNSFKKEYLDIAIKKGIICYISEIKYNNSYYIIVNDIKKALAVISKYFYFDSRKLTLIGVTGTKGKTTTLSFLKDILTTNEKRKIAYFSTIDYYTGNNFGSSHNTTPEADIIYKGIKDAKENDIKYLCMEVSSQATKTNRIYGIEYDYGIFVNISPDHIAPQEHKDFEEYLNCKIAFLKKCNNIIIYKHTDYYDRIISELKDKKIYTVGFTDDCNFYISNIHNDNNISFDLEYNGISYNYSINIEGEFNVINASLSIAVSTLLGISADNIKLGILNTTVKGRMNVYKLNSKTIIVDYAHNKLSLTALLESTKSKYKDSDIKIVFGCPGDKALNRREELAKLSDLYCSYIYLTMEDPGSKNVNDISIDISKFIVSCKYEIINDRKNAIEKAINDLKENDVLLIIGKGDEEYQLINGVYVYYESDLKVVTNYINKSVINV